MHERQVPLASSIVIYTEAITNRLTYACDIVFTHVLKEIFKLTASKEVFKSWDGPKINYSNGQFAFPTVQVSPSTLLFEEGIKPQNLFFAEIDGLATIFPAKSFNKGSIGENKSGFPFDVFSAVFYMVSRYEEYLPFVPDTFGRFTEKQSLSGKRGFTQQPVVDIWCKMLAAALSNQFEDWQPTVKTSKVLFTYDIDVAYSFRGRSLTRHMLSLIKDILHLNFGNIKAKITFRFGKRSDPSDTYDLIAENPLTKIFFFLLAARRSRYDKNISANSVVLQRLIKNIRKKNPVGIHPSYFTIDKQELLGEEKQTLENIIGEKVTQSRQHFLRLRFPNTYRQLIAAGITDDYSLAYAEVPGFRAGTCSPFPFFDLLANQATNLTIHPTCLMDSAFRDDLHLTAAESLPIYKQLFETVMLQGGEFVCIWHNDLLCKRSTDNHPLNFRKTYLDFTRFVMEQLAK